MSEKRCELFAPDHGEEVPLAVARVTLLWESTDQVTGDVTYHRREKRLCASCLKSKQEEFAEIGGTVQVEERYGA
jgi:hypothetical protein